MCARVRARTRTHTHTHTRARARAPYQVYFGVAARPSATARIAAAPNSRGALGTMHEEVLWRRVGVGMGVGVSVSAGVGVGVGVGTLQLPWCT